MAELKDCTSIRREMSITWSPQCERCGDGPCLITRPHEPLHLMHSFGRKCAECGRMTWPGMAGAAPRWTEDPEEWSAAPDNCRSTRPSPPAGPDSLSVPQDAKSNPSNGLVERLRAEAVANHRRATSDLLSEAADALALYQQEGVLTSQRGDWVLVPREPTDAMLFAAREAAAAEASEAFYTPGYICEPDAAIAYRAMLNASPIAPASQRGENRSAKLSDGSGA